MSNLLLHITGGPLVYDYPDGTKSVQVGITSWGFGEWLFSLSSSHYTIKTDCIPFVPFFLPIGCADPSYPGVYARVSEQYAWIINTICSEIGGEGCSDDDDGQDCFNLSDKDTNEQDTEEDDMLPGFIRTMIDNGQIESGVKVSEVRPGSRRSKKQTRERDITRMLMDDNTSLSVSNEVSLIYVTDQFS